MSDAVNSRAQDTGNWFDHPDFEVPFDLLKMSLELDVKADEADDMADHDELHAAGVICYDYWRGVIPSNRAYVLRWVDGVARRVGLLQAHTMKNNLEKGYASAEYDLGRGRSYAEDMYSTMRSSAPVDAFLTGYKMRLDKD